MHSRYPRSNEIFDEKPAPAFEQRIPPAPVPVPREAPRGERLELGIGNLLKGLKIDWDAGDILLILIMLFLFLESDDEEILIMLALILFMGF